MKEKLSLHLSHVFLYELKGLEALYPDVRALANRLIGSAAACNMPIVITETFRSAATQQRYYNQGRVSPGSIITNAEPLKSYHQYGLAFDIAFQGIKPYPSNMDLWIKVGELGETMGLQWGGRFNDNPHFEFHPGYSYQDFMDYFKV